MGEGDSRLVGHNRVVSRSLLSQKRGITYRNIIRFKVLYNSDTGRGNKGIGVYINLFPLETPDVYPFDSNALSRPLILYSIPVSPLPNSLARAI